MLDSARNDTVSIGDWILTFLLTAIPLLGLIMLFVWAFGDSKPSKKNYARAMLIWGLIWAGIVLIASLIITSVAGMGLLGFLQGMASGYY